jgi:3-oxoacyl-[acyl-carrier-protein] synthase III
LNSSWESVHVIFSPHTDFSYLRFLAPGFRHCFVLLSDGRRAVIVEPLARRIDVLSIDLASGAEGIVREFEKMGMTAIRARMREDSRKGWSFGIFTCVEVVKRILGIHGAKVMTPRQLYLFLSRNP